MVEGRSRRDIPERPFLDKLLSKIFIFGRFELAILIYLSIPAGAGIFILSYATPENGPLLQICQASRDYLASLHIVMAPATASRFLFSLWIAGVIPLFALLVLWRIGTLPFRKPG